MRSDLLRGRIRPGERVIEQWAALHYDASRTPVREACRRLAEEGLLVHRPQRGYAAPVIEQSELDELYELRRAIEVLTVRRACGADDRSPRLAAMRSQWDGRLPEAGEEIVYNDEAFHLGIAEIGGNHGRIVASVGGTGPLVMLIHGVAYGPGTLADAVRGVVARGARVVVPHRGGYGASRSVAPGADLDDQVDDLVRVLDVLGAPRAVWVGVSGGATLALAAAIRRPDRVAGVLVHEPALGTLAVDLHARLLGASAAVTAADDPGEGALDLARALGGPAGWAGVDEEVRRDIRAAGPAVRAEIALFPAFAPSPGELGRLRAVPLVSSVGARSGPERHRAGEVLETLTGATAVLTPSGHLVQIEAPSSLAELAVGLAHRALSRPASAEEDA